MLPLYTKPYGAFSYPVSSPSAVVTLLIVKLKIRGSLEADLVWLQAAAIFRHNGCTLTCAPLLKLVLDWKGAGFRDMLNLSAQLLLPLPY